MDLRDQLQRALGDAYTLERELGGGGMSHVFVAEEARLRRKVVVKVLALELAAGVSADRFEREIGVAAQLQHPNIVPVLTAGDSGGVPYYTMPFVEGLSLRARLSRDGALPIGQAVSILRDVARALAYAHEHGVVHRDIEPDNVLLTGDAAVVTDFGIAKALSASRTNAPAGSLTQTGTSLGTPAYMSPEQVTGEAAVDHRADLYAFGVTAYELLTGRPPFDAAFAHRMMAAHVQEAPPPLAARRSDTPRALAALVMQCLEKDPARQPNSSLNSWATSTRRWCCACTGASWPTRPTVIAGSGARPSLILKARTIYSNARRTSPSGFPNEALYQILYHRRTRPCHL
jgi:serine/threonine protein kinase